MQTINVSEINLNIETFQKAGIEIPLRYYAFMKNGNIVNRRNDYLFIEKIGNQENGFTGIEAELSLVDGRFYQMDIYWSTEGNFKRIIERYSSWEFDKVFGIFQDKINECKGLF